MHRVGMSNAQNVSGSGDLEILVIIYTVLYVYMYMYMHMLYMYMYNMYMYENDERYEGGEFGGTVLALVETFIEALGKKYRGNKHSKKGISAFAYLCSSRLPCIVFALQWSKPLHWVFLVQEAAREPQASRTATREKSSSLTDVSKDFKSSCAFRRSWPQLNRHLLGDNH